METSASGSAAVSHGNVDDRDYEAFLERLNTRFMERTNNGTLPLFKTDASDLFTVYLNMFLDADVRQYHNCHSCRRFLELYGSLAVIDDEGRVRSAMWDEADAPAVLAGAIGKLDQLVRRARVETVFLSSDKIWGSPITGQWKHMAITTTPIRYKHPIKTAEQAMAEKREEYRIVSRALAEFDLPTLEQVVHLLRSDALYRSDKVLGPAEWLCNLQRERTAAHGAARQNLVWRAVATAPAGFCHPRSSMIGTLLDDLASGMAFHEVSARFHEKMAPSNYQRPKAAPRAGAIAQAEKMVDGLGIQRSLRRRYLRLEEVPQEHLLWTPRRAEEAAERSGGFFSHLKARGAQARPQQLVTPPQTITWVKFSDQVLGDAEQIELRAPSRGSYCSFVTAADPDAPPILQWDTLEKRNPVSWYFEDKGALASRYGLTPARHYQLSAVMLKPTMWQPGFDHFGKGVMFVIDGARDLETAGLALFPETLKSDLHGVRSVIEAHSRSREMEGRDEASVAGIMVEAGGHWSVPLRVWSRGRQQDYVLDRWD